MQEKRPNACAVGAVTKGNIWRRTARDDRRRDQIMRVEKAMLNMTYLKSAISTIPQDTCKLTAQKLGMEIIGSTHMLSPPQEEITKNFSK